MNKFRFTIKVLAIAIFTFAFASMAQAQASRTWVSGVGDDANPCSRTAPCKTFAGAISKTAQFGEIDALDPGGFGALTITKGITIDGGGGQVASVLVAGSNGILVNAPAGDTVILRNLRLNGLLGTASPGLAGVRWIAGKALIVENCYIFGFSTNGIDVAFTTAVQAQLTVSNCWIEHIQSSGVALQNSNASGSVLATLSNVILNHNGTGITVNQRSHADLTFCNLSMNSNAGGVVQGAGGEELNIDSSQISFNPDGVQTLQGVARVGNSLIGGNGNGLHQIGGILETYGTNRNRGNGNNTLGTVTPVAPS